MKTMNALDSNAKKTSIAILNARLADSIDLALAVKQAHWNIKGPRFIAIHEMLDKLRDDVSVGVDLIAERAAALGGTALGTVQTTMSASKLPPYPTDIHDIDDHLKALIERVAMCTNAMRKNIDETDEAGDAGTADIFTQLSRDLDKWLWFLESHLPK
jgi:starvation-inducible DNA-binding protein